MHPLLIAALGIVYWLLSKDEKDGLQAHSENCNCHAGDYCSCKSDSSSESTDQSLIEEKIPDVEGVKNTSTELPTKSE